MKKLIILIAITICFSNLFGQDRDYARYIIDTLSSPGMHGRGYVNNGDKVAAEFIKNEFIKSELKNFADDYFQEFSIPINTFPDTINVYINDKPLISGEDFVIFSSSPAVSGTFELFWLLLDSAGVLQPVGEFGMIDITDKVIVTDMNQKDFKDGGNFNSKGIIFLKEDKVWWHVSNGKEVLDYFKLQIISDKIPISSKTITIKVNNTYFTDYQTQNVIGFVEGKVEPDSFLVFTAHYDHLGQMGADTYFPGANDNASGTAMLLNLARHYSLSENRPDYSIVFMALSAEEVGLLGSEFYATNPLFPLERIKFLVNLDMVGSGSQGVKVVNGSIFKDKFNLLVKLNTKHEYIRKVEERGEAANSDHYPFYAQGVPCFFIYTLGDECKEYHNIYDVSDNVPLTEYDDFFKLLLDFINTF